MTLSLEMNKVLKSLDAEQTNRLFKTISHDYSQPFMSVSPYWFKIAMNTSFGTIPINTKLYVHIMTEHKIGNPADPYESTFIRDIPINFLRNETEVNNWLAEYINILREIKLNELV